MSRWRIDFAVRELDVPEEQARGIKFGDDCELDDVIDFFERCRDAVRTLLGTRRRDTVEELRAQMAEEKKKADARASRSAAVQASSQVYVPPYDGKGDLEAAIKHTIGSRGYR